MKVGNTETDVLKRDKPHSRDIHYLIKSWCCFLSFLNFKVSCPMGPNHCSRCVALNHSKRQTISSAALQLSHYRRTP
jgi:hypothetical protein